MGDDERALLAAVLVAPGDDLPRLVYADWLDERADDPCRACAGSGYRGPTAADLPPVLERRTPDGRVEYYQELPPLDLSPPPQCPACSGSGRVPGRRYRAEFIRVQCELAQPHPGCHCKGCRPSERHGPALCRAPLRARERELWAGPLGADWAAPIGRQFGLEPRLAWVEGYNPGPPQALFRRGFVEEVRAPLAALFGATCPRCSGEGCSPHAIAANGPCENREGAAAGLWASQPVTRVVLTDAYLIPLEEEVRLGHAPRGWVLGDREGYAAANAGNLLESIQDVIGHTYPTRQAAIDALSAAACALGRARAGLAPKAVAR